MNPKHEALLHTITDEYPQEVEEMKLYAELQPIVSEEYLYELCADNEILTELIEDMITYFYRYTIDVCQQESLKKEGIPENLEEINRREDPRTALHNAMIDSVRILWRNMEKAGKDVAWTQALDKSWDLPIDKVSRARYGKLALLTTFHDIVENFSQK